MPKSSQKILFDFHFQKMPLDFDKTIHNQLIQEDIMLFQPKNLKTGRNSE